jgi:hypothetical protein
MLDRGQLDEVRAYAKEFEPALFHRMQDARPEELARLVAEAHHRMQELRELKERNPEEFQRRLDMARVDQKCWALVDTLRKCDPEDRPELKAKLLEALTQLFDMREEARGRELRELERRVAEVRKALEKRRENKSKIIEKRAEEMLGSDYEW